jgi:Aspartyl protease
MALVSGRLTEGKPIIEITLSDATPVPVGFGPTVDPSAFKIRPYRALLDTGADITCLCDHVVAECKLRPYGFERMIGALGPSLHSTFIVRIGIVFGDESEISNPRGLFQLEPLEAAVIRDNQWFDLIIGTDVLSQHEFALTRGGGFKLTLF